LARALLGRGHRLTIWNRTLDKSIPFESAGANVASTPAQAVSASPLIIMCVYDYVAATAILEQPGVADALKGKTLVQLSTGSLEQVYQQQAWVKERGAKFISGGVIAYPPSVGRPNCVIVFSGDDSFHTHRSTLASLAGSLQYLGTDPAATVGAYFALSSYMIGSLGLFFESAAFARHYGVSIDSYYLLARLVTDEIIEGMRDGAHRVGVGNFDGKLASIDLTVAGMQEVCKTFRQTGMPPTMTESLVNQLKFASAQGDGDKDISRLVESLWGVRVARN
jgi:3-hydroxyisobutyrate dehydrogenase-like beta-hydroxyacid dehydrogenase